MRNVFTSAFVIAMLSTPTFSASPIRSIEQPWNGSLPAVAESGDTFLLTREVKVEVDSPRIGKAIGSLFLIFDRATGYYFRDIRWSKDGYPSYMEYFSKEDHLGVTPKGIWAFEFVPHTCMLVILKGHEKAESLDDAESKALIWAAGHIQELEARKGNINYAGGRQLFLPFASHVNPLNNGLEFVPEALLSLKWHNGLWEFTFDGYQRRDKWYHPPEERKHLKARFTIDSTTVGQSNSFSCVDDKLQETICP